MKKELKKHIKEDEFASGLSKAFHVFETYKKEVFIGLVVVGSLVVLVLGVKWVQSMNMRKASETVSRMLTLRQELETKPENLAEIERMAAEKKTGRMAGLLLATHWVEKGDPAKARAYLEKMDMKPRDLLSYQARDLLGQVYVLQKEYDKAIEVYKKMEDEKPKEYTLDIILFHRAEVLALKGAKDEALALYKKIQADYPQSYYSLEAADRVRRLESGK